MVVVGSTVGVQISIRQTREFMQELRNEWLATGGIGDILQQQLDVLNLLPCGHLGWHKPGILKNAVGDSERGFDHVVAIECQRFTGAGQIIELPFCLRLANFGLCQLIEQIQ